MLLDTHTIIYILIATIFLLIISSIVNIGEQEVGIVFKKISSKKMPPGRIIALNGEAGFQAEALTPGWHFFYWPWQYSIRKDRLTVIPQGEIGLIVAEDGSGIATDRILADYVDCNNFQDASKFLTNNGQRGRQLAILTTGTYRINTALFNVITANTAERNKMLPNQLKVFRLGDDQVGIITTLDGVPIEPGEIAGPSVAGHNNFQDAQAFLKNGGARGLQEQILLSGSWNINPWFAQVEQVAMTGVPIGYVGVVISYVGQASIDVSGKEFKHGNLVDVGHKGVCVTPLYPGKHPLNTRVMNIELVPTTNIVLNWATRTESHAYDSKLSSITVRSKDGFAFNLDVSQIIHVGAPDAPKVISRVGSMQNLVDHVLEPIIGNYFRNSAQDHTVLDFLNARSERQSVAADHIRLALLNYDVQGIDTLIGDITPPEELMKTQTARKIAEEQQKTYEVQESAQKQRQQLVRETSLADIQQQMVQSEQGVRISELNANMLVKQATGEAESIRLRASAEGDSTKFRAAGEAEAIRNLGNAKASAYKVGVDSLGAGAYASLQMMQLISDHNVKIVPDVSVTGAGSSSLADALLGMMARKADVPVVLPKA